MFLQKKQNKTGVFLMANIFLDQRFLITSVEPAWCELKEHRNEGDELWNESKLYI